VSADGIPVIVEQHGATLIISINRPNQRNAVNRTVSLAIADAIDWLERDDTLRMGILTGEGDTFCSGMDLAAYLDCERPELEGRGFGGLTEAPPCKPLIAAVEGYALAGGCELALACDMIVAAENASFGLPEVCRGLVAGSGGLIRLARRIPPAIAMEFALTGERIAAPVAHHWGLVNRLTKPGGARAAAIALAETIAANAPMSVAASKQIINQSADWSASECWDAQRSLVELVVNSDDAHEGARAFVEKRPPVWVGR
jgi:enoyl-CoA hydratase